MNEASGHDSGLCIGLLGPVEVSAAGRAPARIPQQGMRAVLAMLAMSANRIVPIGALIDAVWEEPHSRHREGNLHTLVYQLRRRLAELEPSAPRSRLQTQHPGYRLLLSETELDVSRFAFRTRQARAFARAGNFEDAVRQFTEALDLWRGPALEDVIGGCARLSGDAARLEEQRLSAVEEKLDAELDLGRHADLIAELMALVAENPLRERLRAQLMMALYRTGRQPEALDTFRAARQLLLDELGLDPGPALSDLHQKILRTDPSLASPVAAGPDRRAEVAGITTERSPVAPPADLTVVPRQLPAVIPAFAGRTAQLTQLDDVLRSQRAPRGAPRIASIGGMAGVGKTTLAIYWAHQIADQFPDGQLYANLQGFHADDAPRAPSDVTRAFLDALGVSPKRIPVSTDAQAGLYRSLLAERRMLIVLDNAADPAQARPLIPAGAGCMVIVTSRSDMAGLTASDGAIPVAVDILTTDEAETLLAARLGMARVSAEPSAVTELISSCAGLPLALTIVAARGAALTGQSLGELASDLRGDRLGALETGEQATSIRAVFSWSYHRLSERAQRMFRHLSMHPGPDASVAAAASLAGCPRKEARLALDDLARACLLAQPRRNRFGFHDLLRAYATELSFATDTEEDRNAATSRMLDHYLHTSHRAAIVLDPYLPPLQLGTPAAGTEPVPIADRAGALSWFTAEYQALLAVTFGAAAAGYDTHAWQIAWALRNYLDRQGHWHDWAAISTCALAAAERTGDDTALAWSYHRAGTACYRLGRFEDAAAHHARAVEHFRRCGDVGGQAAAHLGISRACKHLHRDLDGQQHAVEALEIARAARDTSTEAFGLREVGWWHARLGRPELARQFCEQSLQLALTLGDLRLQADAVAYLGYAQHQAGQYADAIESLERAVTLYRELADAPGHAQALIWAGDAHTLLGNRQAARQDWTQALTILGDSSSPEADRIRAALSEREADHRH
jgi:DNA-binding SARP family transcriptional activator